jgi:hypothetical protein
MYAAYMLPDLLQLGVVLLIGLLLGLECVVVLHEDLDVLIPHCTHT